MGFSRPDVAGGPGSDTTAWHYGGDTVGSEQTLGTNDAFDVPLVRGGVERARITSNGLQVVAGAEATPSYTFDGDENTGFYRISEDDIGFVVLDSQKNSENAVATVVPSWPPT